MDSGIVSLGELAVAEGWTAAEQRAMEAELLRGWNAKKAMEKSAEAEARREAKEFREFHQRKGVLAKPVLSIPQQDFLEIVAAHGHEFFNHRENIRWIQNKHPEFKAFNA